MFFSPSGSLNNISKYFVILLLSALIGCSAARRFGIQENENKTGQNNLVPSITPVIRVLMNNPSGDFTLSQDTNLILTDDEGKNYKIDKNEKITFTVMSGKVACSGSVNKVSGTFEIKSDKDITINKKTYSGPIKILTDSKQIFFINYLSLEEYLKGVVPSEMPVGKGDEYFEALKAFAICARTFAINRIMASKSLFDVRTDVSDQVYGGTGRKKMISDKAVEETSGMIVTYNGNPARIFYSSTCGGNTEDAENVFGTEIFPYLRSIKDGDEPYCSASPKIKWEEKISLTRVVELLYKAGKIPDTEYNLMDMKINSRFRSGRVNEFEILLEERGGGEKSIKLYGNNIRFILLANGNNTLNSNNFEIQKNGNEFILKGKGWGHGVGMCQWGTLIQSVKGISYSDIIEHYFPGTELSRYYGKN